MNQLSIQTAPFPSELSITLKSPGIRPLQLSLHVRDISHLAGHTSPLVPIQLQCKTVLLPGPVTQEWKHSCGNCVKISWSATAAFLKNEVAGCSLLLSFVDTLNTVMDDVQNRTKSMSVLRTDVLKRQHRVLAVPFVAMPGMAEFSSSSWKSQVTALPLATSWSAKTHLYVYMCNF